MRMKRLISLFMIAVLAFIVAGCAGGQQGAATSSDKSSSGAAAQTDTDVDKNTKPADESKQSTQTEKKAAAEVSKTGFQVWKDSLGSVWGHGAIEIKNTGNVPIRIGDISISFVGKDKTVLGTLSMVLPVPEIIQPGETAYAGDSTVLEGIKEPTEVANIEANIDFDETDKTAQLLEVSDLKITPSEFSGFKITGRVNNISSENADDIRIIIAMFDEKDNLLGVYTESPQVTLAPGKSMGFEASYPPIEVKDFTSKVKKMVSKAFNWKFDI